jgi:hypothetical protein
MARNVIKYRLTAEGTVPSFLYLGEDGVGGVYGVADPSTPSPRDLVMIGITNDGATGDFEVVSTKDDLQSYLTTVGANWTQPDPANSNDPTATIPFDPAAAATWVWDRFTALGGV